MKYLAGMILLLLVNASAAHECQIEGQPWVDMRVNVLNVHANLQLDDVARKIRVTGERVYCRNSFLTSGLILPSNYTEVISTPPYAVFPVAGPVQSYEVGLRYGGADHSMPMGNFVMASTDKTNSIAVLPLNMYIKLPPGHYPTITANQGVGSFTFNVRYPVELYNFRNFIMQVNVFARNSLFPPAPVCTINNNAPLDVNFGLSIDPLAIGLSAISAPHKVTRRLNYSCTGPIVTTGINIRLQGTSAVFASTALATNNPDVGVVMLRTSSMATVAPGGQFNTSITNSTGGDDVTFALVRKSDSTPAAGPFTGSATLILSMP